MPPTWSRVRNAPCKWEGFGGRRLCWTPSGSRSASRKGAARSPERGPFALRNGRPNLRVGRKLVQTAAMFASTPMLMVSRRPMAPICLQIRARSAPTSSLRTSGRCRATPKSTIQRYQELASGIPALPRARPRKGSHAEARRRRKKHHSFQALRLEANTAGWQHLHIDSSAHIHARKRAAQR